MNQSICFELQMLKNIRSQLDQDKDFSKFVEIDSQIKAIEKANPNEAFRTELLFQIDQGFTQVPSTKRPPKYDIDSQTRLNQYFQGEKIPKSTMTGGEGKIYPSLTKPNEAIKIWNPSRIDDFERSVNGMIVYKEIVDQSSDLSKNLKVAKVLERGDSYIVKEFFPDSKKIKAVMKDPQVAKAYEETLEALSKKDDFLSNRMYQALKKKSENYHWDPISKKIVLIDALGF
jgi:hypothetical protein